MASLSEAHKWALCPGDQSYPQTQVWTDRRMLQSLLAMVLVWLTPAASLAQKLTCQLAAGVSYHLLLGCTHIQLQGPRCLPLSRV